MPSMDFVNMETIVIENTNRKCVKLDVQILKHGKNVTQKFFIPFKMNPFAHMEMTLPTTTNLACVSKFELRGLCLLQE